MSEIHANLYFKHPDEGINSQLVQMFEIFDLNSKFKITDANLSGIRFIEIAKSVNSSIGEKLAEDLLKLFPQAYGCEFGSESINTQSGYSVSHWVNGSSGFEIQASLMHFLYNLCPDIHAQAWACGDDDPYEEWFKFDNNNVYSSEDCPYTVKDTCIYQTIYQWWHSTMHGETVLNILTLEL